MEIRALTRDDAQIFWRFRLLALEREPFAFGESDTEHRSRSIESMATRLGATTEEQFLLGAFDGRELVGSAGFRRYEGLKERHKGRIWGVYVADAFRGQGIARTLLTELLERARRIAGIDQIILTVAATQTAAKGLYASLGFEWFGCEPCALRVGDDSVDEIYMVLRLRSP